MYRFRELSFPLLCLLVVAVATTPPAWGHTLGDPVPFHLSPGDAFTIPVVGGTFASAATVVVRFTPVGGGADTDQSPEEVVADTSVGVRLPAGLAVGQYDVSVRLAGTASDAPVRIWVRQRPFQLIRRSSVHLPGMPAGANFKDTDFADVDNDGFLDVFEANSVSGSDVDRLLLNQRGRAPGARDCLGTDFCDVTTTHYENSVAGIPAAQRTYDADLVDLDLDADLDLVRIDQRSDAPIRIQLNDGTGHFTDRSITRMGIGPALLPSLTTLGGITTTTARVDTGDVDGDGRPDVLACSWFNSGGTEGQNLLLLNRLHTGGGFVIANDAPCNPASPSAHALCRIRAEINRGCAFGHFNGDDRLDILAATMDPDRPDFVLINTGNVGGIPQFEVHDDWVRASTGGVQEPRNGGNVFVADLDGDGDDDAVIASPRNEQKRRILWNDAGTRLVELADDRYPFAGDSYDAQLADLDRDGDLDLLTSPEGGSGNPVLINQGGRNGMVRFEERPASQVWFAEGPGGATVTAPPDFNISLSPGDYDLDGDLDLLTGGYSDVKLWRNDLFDSPGEDRDWVFALDRTGSMISGLRNFFEPAKNVVKTFLGQRRSGDRVGLVTFDYAGTDPFNANAADDATKAQIAATVGARTKEELQVDVEDLDIGTCSGFCTAIGWALKTAVEVAATTPAPDASREKVVVLVTDGRQNQGPHPDTVIPTIPSHVRLYTIALGSDTDDRMLSALATNGGKFYFAGRSDDYASVQSALRDVDEDLEGDATGKEPLLPSSRWAGFPLVARTLAQSPLLAHLASLRLFEPIRATIDPPARLDAFVVDPADRQVRFTLSWRGASKTNRMILTDPKGRNYPLAGDPLVREHRSDKAHVIEVADPLSGIWLLRPEVDPDTGPAKATAIASTDLELEVAPAFPLFFVGESLVLHATLAGAPAGVIAEAQVRTPGRTTETISGRPTAKGFEFRLDNALEPGSYRFDLALVGPPGRPFLRTWQGVVHVAEPTAEEPDLRTAAVTLDRDRLVAGGDTAVATLELRRRDGSPLAGAPVSFDATLGELLGSPQDVGDGRYRQTLRTGPGAGAGELRARVGLTRLPTTAPYRVSAAGPDPGRSDFQVIIGRLRLCLGEEGPFALQVTPRDAFDNPLSGVQVEIEQSGGPRLEWAGPVVETGGGQIYRRRFETPTRAGEYRFRAKVLGVPLAREVVLPVDSGKTAEGRALGCSEPKKQSWCRCFRDWWAKKKAAHHAKKGTP